MTVLCDNCSPRKGCTADKNRTECKYYQPMTNEEWLCEYLIQFCKMSTNEKAERIADLVANFIPQIEEINCNEFAWFRWLKEKHDEM